MNVLENIANIAHYVGDDAVHIVECCLNGCSKWVPQDGQRANGPTKQTTDGNIVPVICYFVKASIIPFLSLPNVGIYIYNILNIFPNRRVLVSSKPIPFHIKTILHLFVKNEMWRIIFCDLSFSLPLALLEIRQSWGSIIA